MAKMKDHFAALVDNEFLQRSQKFMTDDLAASGLVDSDMYAVPLSSIPLGMTKKPEWVLAAYKIPYLTPEGNQHQHMYRIKLQWKPHVTKAMLDAEELNKYTQPKAEILATVGVRGNYPYMPSHKVDSDVLLICEGEKKSVIAQDRFGCCVIGVGGANSWRSERGSGLVHPEILRIVEGRKWTRVILVPDPDYHTNSNVAGGWTGLYTRLVSTGAAASIVVLPAKLDDFLLAHDDYTIEEFLAEDAVPEDALQMSLRDLVAEYQLSVTERGSIVNNHGNLKALVANHPKWSGGIKRNTDTGLIEWFGDKFDEHAIPSQVCAFLNSHLYMKQTSLRAVYDVITAIAAENQYSPLRDEIMEVEWDGKRRARFIFGDKDRSPNEFAIAESLVYGYVRRILNPGCFWRTMVILTGAQHVGKTGTARWLVGDKGSVANVHSGELRIVSKDTIMKFMTCNVALFDDIDTLSKGDEGQLKTMISTEQDKIRASYGREHTVYKRRGIVMGTSNHKMVIPYDPTGNTRFCALELYEMQDWEWLYDNRPQILAECREMKEAPVIDFSQMAQYVDKDPLHDAAEEWVEGITGGDKDISRWLLQSGTERRFFKAASFWAWHKGQLYIPRHDEKKRLGGYFRALGLEYCDNNVMRTASGFLKKVWEVPQGVTGVTEG